MDAIFGRKHDGKLRMLVRLLLKMLERLGNILYIRLYSTKYT